MTTDAQVPGPICLHDLPNPMAWVTTSQERPQKPEGSGRVIEIAAVWNNTILALQHLKEGEVYRPDAALPFPDGVLPHAGFELLRWEHGEALCRFVRGWRGTLRSQELSQNFDDLLEQGSALPDEDEIHHFVLGGGQQVVVDVGPLTFIARLVAPGRSVVAHTDGLDAPFVGITSFTAFLAAAFTYVAATAPPAAAVQMYEIPDRFVQVVMETPTPEPALKLPVHKKNSGEREGKKAKRDEGKVGKKDGAMERARGSKVAKALHDREVVKDAGVFGAMSDQGMDAIFGTSGLSQDITGGIGGLIGHKGTQLGSNGLSSRGGGLGGGGEAEDLGGLGTHGRGGGEMDYGEADLGPRSADPGIASIGNGGLIVGALDASLIDGVIRRNLPRFRYCYQRELTKDPTLAGKVTVKFTIIGDGTVSAAMTKASSMQSPAVESCLNRVMMTLPFPEPNGGGLVLVSYPFVFSPG